jgi:hypothetical protein
MLIANNFMNYSIFNIMTRDELRAIAKQANIPRGRNSKDTIANLNQAATDGIIRVKQISFVQIPPSNTTTYWKTISMSTV